MTPKTRFIVIGCGRMGRRRIRSIMNHPEAELVGVVDVSEQDAQTAAAECHRPHYHDYKEVLSRDDVDCVIVSVPNKWHKSTVVDALESGKHVFCEKPLALNPDEARAMVEAADANGVTLKTGSNLRFFPNVLKARELLDQEAIGDPLFLRAWIGHNGWNLGDTWFAKKEIAGGGTFLDNGCHLLDIARWFMGEVKSCVGGTQTSHWSVQPLEDNGFGIFETVDGRNIFVQASWTEWKGYMYMEIYGSRGYIRVDSRGSACTTVLGNRKGEEEIFDYSSLPATSFQAEFDGYMRALRTRSLPMPSGRDGLRAVEMVWAVYQSARTGRRVEI